ncbi:MAG TPA: hypothetical protein VK255_02405, partial [Patescibacteria group bacterium]|nr:hypothetical protein [Patescibacteria group bacterium]
FLGLSIYVPVLAIAPANPGNSNKPLKNNYQERKDIREERQVQKQENLCQRISDLANREQERLTQRTKNSGDRFQNWQQKTTEKDSELANLRSSWDDNRNDQFKKLEEKATTDAQKKAVADFEAAVKAAIAARRTAVDAAITTFREGVKKLISDRSESVSSGFSAFTKAVQAAYGTAKSDCANSKDPATIRTTLRNSIQAARAKFHSEKTSAKVGGNIQTLIDARRTAVNKAMTDFKAAMEKARTDLKKAFPTD